jgi:hypothetical protein
VCLTPICIDYGKSTARLVPCGRCIECVESRAKQWTVRLSHELTQHDESSFITLTYSDDQIPDDWKLRTRDVQLFLKRLRKDFDLRYFVTGEYAPETRRPHYHGVLFGLSLDNNDLADYWSHGLCYSGDVTLKSIQYVTKYCVKIDSDKQTRPFCLMSRRPGLGHSMISKVDTSTVSLSGRKFMVPRYYRTHKDLPLENFYHIEHSRQDFLNSKDFPVPVLERKELPAKLRVDMLKQKDLDALRRLSIIKSKAR